MLKKIFHWLVAIPRIYDLVQNLAGAPVLRRTMHQALSSLPPGSLVVDVGGGTGLNASILPASCIYICLDSDLQKLAGFKEKTLPDEPQAGIALLGDAGSMPLQAHSAGLVMCTFVSHHIPDKILAKLFQECARILKPDGVFFFVDAVWATERRISRLLWKYDRGSYPRSLSALRHSFETYFSVQNTEIVEIYHQYVFLQGKTRFGTDQRTDL